MAKTAKIDLTENSILSGIQAFLKSVLEQKEINSILIPQHMPMNNVIMPVLINDPQQLDKADPLAPSFPLNAAKLASRLTRKSTSERVLVFLRSCEIRAFIELVKLKQGSTENLLLASVDCLGAYSNADYRTFAGEDAVGASTRFYESVLSDQGASLDGFELTPACQMCDSPVSDVADISFVLYGVDASKALMIQSNSDEGDALINALGLAEADMPESRQSSIDTLVNQRKEALQKTMETTSGEIGSIKKLTNYLSRCVNCYNCRVACPVCYCKECVFNTDVFDHEPVQYLKWASRKGVVKMPTDTVFFHLTRVAHMSLACVGCGQCTNACPNDIPLAELFRTLSFETQKSFDYLAGRSLDEAPPLSQFKEDEYQEVVGVSK